MNSNDRAGPRATLPLVRCCRLHPQKHRRRSRTGVQLPRRPARSGRGLRPQPGRTGLGPAARPLRRRRLHRRQHGPARPSGRGPGTGPGELLLRGERSVPLTPLSRPPISPSFLVRCSLLRHRVSGFCEGERAQSSVRNAEFRLPSLRGLANVWPRVAAQKALVGRPRPFYNATTRPGSGTASADSDDCLHNPRPRSQGALP